MENSNIEWTDDTWNPVTGCRHGCDYCYADNMAHRFDGGKVLKYGVRTVLEEPVVINGVAAPYPYGFVPTFHKYRLDKYKNKKGRKIFVCSMADLFGEWVPDEWIVDVFQACEAAPQHTYMFLTKNPERYYHLEDTGDLPDYENMWYGITVTNKAQLERAVNAAGKLTCTVNAFLSIEPLHEDITQSEYWKTEVLRDYFGWFIIGAETGRRPGKITPEREWIENIVETCSNIGRPVFLKSGRGIMEEIWGEPLIQQYPAKMGGGNK